MRIENFDLEPTGSGRTTLATFDVEISPDITLRNWILRLNHEGQYRCSPPRMAGGFRPISLSPRLRDDMNAAAIAAYRATTGGPLAHDTNPPR